MNYPMHNYFPYSQITQQSFDGQQFINPFLQPPIPPYGNFPMDPFMQNQQQLNASQYNVPSITTTENSAMPSIQSSVINYDTLNEFQQSSNLSSRTNPSKPKESTRLYYCETCRIACGGYNSYRAHLNGSKHKRKETGSQNQLPYQQIFQCELCDIRCTSSDAYKAHLDGTKHNKAVKLYQKLGKPIPENIDLPLVTINQPQSIMIDEQKKGKESSEDFIGTEYIETMYDDEQIARSYYCKLCDCKFNDSNARDAHLKGRRHKLVYKKKLDLNARVGDSDGNSDNKPFDFTDDANETVEDNSEQQTNSNDSFDFDKDTRYLMNLHQQIIPMPSLLDTIEQFVNATEAALKLCSDRLSLENTSGTRISGSPLLGVSRVGAYVKNLLIQTDRLFQIVVVCNEWPTIKLLCKISSILYETFDKTWKCNINIICEQDKEIIRVYANTNEGAMSITIAFTSTSILNRENNIILEQHLSKTNCLNALYSMNSVRWFQNRISNRKNASALIRCLRYKTTISSKWKSLSSEILEILIEHLSSKSKSAIDTFRQALEYLSSGLVLSDGEILRIPWETNEINDSFSKLSIQERNDITHEAQNGLRLMSFGQLNKWFEATEILKSMKPLQKNFCSNYKNEISVKQEYLKSDYNN